MHGLAHRDSGGQHLFDRSLPSKLTKASVHGGDEVRKLIGPDRMMSQVTPADFRRINIRIRKAFEKRKILHPSSIRSLFDRPNLASGAVMIVRKPAYLVVEARISAADFPLGICPCPHLYGWFFPGTFDP